MASMLTVVSTIVIILIRITSSVKMQIILNKFNALRKETEKRNLTCKKEIIHFDGRDDEFLVAFPAEGIKVWMTYSYVTVWGAQINGTGPYEGQIFTLKLTFGDQFPFTPPDVSFLSDIKHPNVWKDKICMDTFHQEISNGGPWSWSPILSISKLLLMIQSILDSPTIDGAFDPSLASLYETNQSKYNSVVSLRKEEQIDSQIETKLHHFSSMKEAFFKDNSLTVQISIDKIECFELNCTRSKQALKEAQKYLPTFRHGKGFAVFTGPNSNEARKRLGNVVKTWVIRDAYKVYDEHVEAVHWELSCIPYHSVVSELFNNWNFDGCKCWLYNELRYNEMTQDISNSRVAYFTLSLSISNQTGFAGINWNQVTYDSLGWHGPKYQSPSAQTKTSFSDNFLILYHLTEERFAKQIILDHMRMKPSDREMLLLGPGIYFAPNVEACSRKAFYQEKGSQVIIQANVFVGNCQTIWWDRMKQSNVVFEKPLIREQSCYDSLYAPYGSNGPWLSNYVQSGGVLLFKKEDVEEYCIPDPEQVIITRMITVEKVKEFGTREMSVPWF
eukprot:510905_1